MRSAAGAKLRVGISLAAYERVEARYRFGELARVAAAGLGEVGAAAAAAADDGGELLDDVAGLEATGRAPWSRVHDEQRAAVRSPRAEHDHRRRELVAQLVGELAQRLGVADVDHRAEHA